MLCTYTCLFHTEMRVTIAYFHSKKHRAHYSNSIQWKATRVSLNLYGFQMLQRYFEKTAFHWKTPNFQTAVDITLNEAADCFCNGKQQSSPLLPGLDYAVQPLRRAAGIHPLLQKPGSPVVYFPRFYFQNGKGCLLLSLMAFYREAVLVKDSPLGLSHLL